MPGTLTRIPLEGYREKSSTRTVLGSRFASKPLELDIPLMVTGMSYGALSRNAKTALSRGARMAGTSTTTGDNGARRESELETRRAWRTVRSRASTRQGQTMGNQAKTTPTHDSKVDRGDIVSASRISIKVSSMPSEAAAI